MQMQVTEEAFLLVGLVTLSIMLHLFCPSWGFISHRICIRYFWSGDNILLAQEMRQYQDGHSLFIDTQTNIIRRHIYLSIKCVSKKTVIIKIKIGDDLSTI